MLPLPKALYQYAYTWLLFLGYEPFANILYWLDDLKVDVRIITNVWGKWRNYFSRSSSYEHSVGQGVLGTLGLELGADVLVLEWELWADCWYLLV